MDIEIRAIDEPTRRLQITTAGPLWQGGTANWGADHALHMQQLNQDGLSSGWGPYQKQPDGLITNRNQALGASERDPPFAAGIRQALERKRHNQHSDCELVVYATGYHVLGRETFERMAREALRDIVLPNFLCVHVLSDREGYFVSSARH